MSNEFILTGTTATTSALRATSSMSTTSDSEETKSEECTTSLSTELAKPTHSTSIGMIGATCPAATSMATLSQSPYILGDISHTIIASSGTACWIRRPGRYVVDLNLEVKTTYTTDIVTAAGTATEFSGGQFTTSVRFNTNALTGSCPTTGQITVNIPSLVLPASSAAGAFPTINYNVTRHFQVDIVSPTSVSVLFNTLGVPATGTTINGIILGTGAASGVFATLTSNINTTGRSVLGFIRIRRTARTPCNPWGPF